MGFPFYAVVQVANERQALELFVWALRNGNTSCIEIIKAAVPAAQHWDTPIEDLDLVVVGYNRLKQAGANTVAEVISMSATQVRGLRHARQPMTDAAYGNIVARLAELNIMLREE